MDKKRKPIALFSVDIDMIFCFSLMVTGEECERGKSRTVRKVVYKELIPVYKEFGIQIPYNCPFLKERDRYIENEEHKERESVNRWSCGYCGKAFIGEIYLDSHFDNRHADTVYKERDSVCLADYCEIFRCDIISGAAEATFWDVALCMEEDMQDLTQDCQELLNTCIPDRLSWNVTNRLRSSLMNSVCSYLTCKKYWDTPVVPEDEEPPTVYIVFTVLLIVGISIYYCVAFNYFLTDTFSDMYDSDELVVKNSNSLTSREPAQTPKKLKHRTRPKAFIDGESFLSPGKLNTRQNLETSLDRFSKRRHLETNEDLFNIRKHETVSDMNEVDVSSMGDTHRIDNIDTNNPGHLNGGLDTDIKEMDYR